MSWEDDIVIDYEGMTAPFHLGDTNYKTFGTSGNWVVFIHRFGLHSAIFHVLAEASSSSNYNTKVFMAEFTERW